MVTRNHLGQVAMSLCLKLPACKNAEEAELSAVLHGFEALSKVYKGRVCVETDCSSIPALLDHKATNQSALFPLVSDTRDNAAVHGGDFQYNQTNQQQSGTRVGRASEETRKQHYGWGCSLHD